MNTKIKTTEEIINYFNNIEAVYVEDNNTLIVLGTNKELSSDCLMIDYINAYVAERNAEKISKLIEITA
jgi:hypothetical protein